MSLLKELFESGAHFGHQKKFWNPNMMPYIFGEKNGIHIINLDKTVEAIHDLEKVFYNMGLNNNQILLVGTKRVAAEAIYSTAKLLKLPYVVRRWLGGTLTNYKTIKSSIKRLENLVYQRENGLFDKLTKKEALMKSREIDDLEHSIGGIKNMRGLPDAIFIVDIVNEHIALKEARKLSIPVFAITDTNSDPSLVAHAVPANDDSEKTIRTILGRLTLSYEKGLHAAAQNPTNTSEEENGN